MSINEIERLDAFLKLKEEILKHQVAEILRISVRQVKKEYFHKPLTFTRYEKSHQKKTL